MLVLLFRYWLVIKSNNSIKLTRSNLFCIQFIDKNNWGGLMKRDLREMIGNYRPVGRAVTRSSLEREVRGSNLGPVKSDTVLPTARHRCSISSKEAVLPGRNDTEMGPANSLHASA